MSQNEAFAAAAHMHVVLRRKTGRVTDTEWMVNNADYARAIVHFAREKAHSEGLAELLPLADRLESLAAPAIVVQPRSGINASTPATTSGTASASATDISARYIGRLR
jgi:hypothetical protein